MKFVRSAECLLLQKKSKGFCKLQMDKSILGYPTVFLDIHFARTLLMSRDDGLCSDIEQKSGSGIFIDDNSEMHFLKSRIFTVEIAHWIE